MCLGVYSNIDCYFGAAVVFISAISMALTPLKEAQATHNMMSALKLMCYSMLSVSAWKSLALMFPL